MDVYVLGIFLIPFLEFVVNLFLWNRLPDRVAIHWNAKGVADGFTGKFWGLNLFPVIQIGLGILLLVVSYLEDAGIELHEFFFVVQIFFACLNILTVLYNMGVKLVRRKMASFIIACFGWFWIYIGYFLLFVERNTLIGVRMPWTVNNDEVWNRTHEVAGWGAIISGIMFIISAVLLKKRAVLVFISVVIGEAVAICVYSYYLSKVIGSEVN